MCLWDSTIRLHLLFILRGLRLGRLGLRSRRLTRLSMRLIRLRLRRLRRMAQFSVNPKIHEVKG